MKHQLIEFLKDIVDIDFKMSFEKWLMVLAVIFFCACAGSAIGAYILMYWS